jgi:hypothetical protein
MTRWTLSVALAGIAAVAAPATAPTFDGEQLNYSINWPSGLSLGEAQFHSTRTKPTPKSGERYDFEFSIDAGIPGFAVSDRYRSSASPDFCSIEFEKVTSHGKKKADEKTVFDPQKNAATRETKGGGKSDLSTSACAKDALDFIYFLRRELAQGRLPPRQTIYFGAPYEVRMEFAGTQSIRVGDKAVEADRLNTTVKGPQSDVSFEIYFLKDAARTPALVRVPLAVGTFSMELVK